VKRVEGLLIALLVSWAASAAADTELTIVTKKGYVAFVAADHWPVLQMETEMPVAVAVFQLPNAADEDTPDSTNLIVQLFERGSEQEKTIYEAPVRQHGADAPAVESFEAWQIYRQTAEQGSTTYSIWDARKGGVVDVSVSVRLAWPHLPKNAPGYAAEMERTFRTFLQSIRGGLGEYRPREGEVMRRPGDGR
jgi:hypothetical protein